MKKQDSQCSLPRKMRNARMLTDSISSDEGPETERLLASQLPRAVVAAASGRRQSLTAPPSPTDSRKKVVARPHNYMNHLHHLIHWRDIWGGEHHKGQESLHRSESMLSVACFKTLQQLINSDSPGELQQYLANNNNVNVDDKDENGTTALMCASEHGRAAAVRLLLDCGADAAAADADGWTPLAFAARGGHAAVVRELLDAGAKVDARDCGGWTPLMWASYKGHEEIVAMLLEKGADVHAHGHYNINSLVWAAGRRHSGVVQRLLAAGARANSADKYATSALTWAARAGDAVSCAALLRAGADPNTAGMYCWTPLLQATHGNHLEIVQMLLEHKPNVNALDKDGYTALAIACKEGYYDIAVALINTGAYINVQDHSKDTPLIHAVKGGHKNIVEALLKKHVDVDLPGKEKKTPVYTAVEKGHVAILKLLLASNPDLEHCTSSGDTPLLRAVRSRNAEMVQLLLERKVRVNVADNRGDTALHIAMRARSKQIVEILLRNPKNSQLLYKPNKLNETPYNIDMSYNKTILGQIFGARKLNTNEDNENMLGYELYSAALADMLSEPSLSVPITVGLYARWGSGKSFLLSKLKEEMKNFARQWSETGWVWSWAVSWGAWHVALSVGACTAVAGAPAYVAVAVCFALFAAIYLALYMFWSLGNKYEWWWAGGLLSALGRRFSALLLVLQVVFCHPPGPNDPRALPATPIRFHFTEGMKSGSQEGEAMVVQMIASLAEALECQYGRICTRLARAFRPRPVSSTSGWKWRRVCCIPHIVTFEVCFTCILVGLCVLVMYFTDANNDAQRREIQQGLMIGASAVAGAMLLANLYTWGRVLLALLLPPRARLTRALRRDAPTLALRPEVQTLTHIIMEINNKRKSSDGGQTRRKRCRKATRDATTPVWLVEEIQPQETTTGPVDQQPGQTSQPEQSTQPELMTPEPGQVMPQPEQMTSQPAPEQRTSGFTIEEVLKLVSSFQEKEKGQSQRLSNNHMNNVIPEFDPTNKGQNVDSWLRKVNECSCIYSWDQKQTIHFALQKLTGLAKKWFEALPSVNYSWDEWQAKLRKAFPNEQNYGRLLEEMLARTSRYNENLRDYFYDKLTLLNRCEIKGEKAVDCVVHGILDKSIRNGAQALNCKEPEDLLNFLISQRPTDMTYVRRRNESFPSFPAKQMRPNRFTNAAAASTLNEVSVTCFNCRSKGHTFHKCPNPIVKCQKCSRVGHDMATCSLVPLTPRQTTANKSEDKKTLTISTVNDSNDKFYKKVVVNDQDFLAYIDFGSECSLMRDSDALKLNLPRCINELPAIKGFGNSSVMPIYRSFITLRLDEVEARVEVLVVHDEFLRTPLLIGQDFTELPCVTVLKDSDKLLFYKSPVVSEIPRHDNNIKLRNIDSTEVQQIGLVEVCTEDSTYCGDIYAEGHTCVEPGREYHLHQGVYRIEQGKGHVVLTNLRSDKLVIPQNALLTRAMPFVERTTCSVNRISKDLSNMEPLDRAEIQVGKDVSDEDVDRLYNLLQSYRDCFAKNLGEIGLAKDIEMTIDLNDDRPIIYRPYRLSFSEREQVRDIVTELLQNDVIQESDSEFASPILMVRKKTGEQRLCVDYRALNNKTRKDCFPLPLIEDQLSNLSGNCFFTSLDLASGYYQIPMAQESRRYTGFVTPDGHYEFKRMPFGLANAPAVFQRLINKMLGSKRFESALAYLDDILVPSESLEQGFHRLEEILKLLREYGLTLKLSKCRFFDNVIKYLGYEISANGIRPDENKILAVKEFPNPKTVHEVRQFLGLAGYFRKFVKGFGEIARPLTNLLKKDVPFQWSDKEMNAFTSLKEKLIERPILSLYSPKLDTELHTDASALGIGGILLQWQENPRTLKPVAYFSRQTSPEERHLHSYELETLAIVCSLRKFRVYLIGVDFKVVTDCHAIITTLTKRDLVPRIARWWLQISEFTFNIEYRPGAQMAHVDALSRNTKLTDLIDDPTMTVYNIGTDDWLLTLQMTDPDIARIVKVLKPDNDEESKDIKKNYVVKDHKLYRKVDDKICLMVPRSARFQICRSNHDDIGHLGETKTIEKIQSIYWFPKLRKFVKKYVRSCIQCAYNKDSAKNQKTGHLHPIQKVSVPFHTVHIDHLGPFTKSKKGNAYILTVVDGFTKYVFAKPVKDTKTKSTLKVLESIFYDFCLPSRIISDRGTSFTSGDFKKFCDLHGIKHVLNAVACPRANGQAERFNQTILNSLKKHNTGGGERDWDTCLGKIQWGINNTINTSTGKTASEALFGCRFPDELTNKLGIDTNNKTDNIETIRNDVSSAIEATQRKEKLRHDRGRAPAAVYREGELVKITRTNYYNKGSSSKLLSKFIGPYKIIKVLDNDRYKISNVPGFNKKSQSFETVVAADRIRPWINTHPSQSTIEKSDRESVESSDYDSDDDLPLSVLQRQHQMIDKN